MPRLLLPLSRSCRTSVRGCLRRRAGHSAREPAAQAFTQLKTMPHDVAARASAGAPSVRSRQLADKRSMRGTRDFETVHGLYGIRRGHTLIATRTGWQPCSASKTSGSEESQIQGPAVHCWTRAAMLDGVTIVSECAAPSE